MGPSQTKLLLVVLAFQKYLRATSACASDTFYDPYCSNLKAIPMGEEEEEEEGEEEGKKIFNHIPV